MDELASVIEEFLFESRASLDQVRLELAQTGDRAPGMEVLANTCRAIHTIKGSCGFLALQRLETLSRAGEGLLVQLRDGDLTWQPEMTALLLSLIDRVTTILASIERTGHEGNEEDDTMIGLLMSLQEPANRITGDNSETAVAYHSPG